MLTVAIGGSGATPMFLGRVNTFRTPGRAGTAGQKLFAMFNAAGSQVTVNVQHLNVELVQTVVKAVTVLPPIVRVHRIAALPTQGAALTKVTRDSTLTTSASVTVHGDASADGTSAGTALVAAPVASSVLAQSFAARLLTAVGYQMFDQRKFFAASSHRMRPGEGIVVELAYTLATQNPVTDMWLVSADWYESAW